VPSAPDDTFAPLARAAARLLRAEVAAAVACLIVGLAGRALAHDAAWPHALVFAGTGIVVAAPLLTLGLVAWGAPIRRIRVLAVLGMLLTAVGALLAR